LALELLPKYAAFENERRWLVDLDLVQRSSWFETWEICDHYLDCGLLRLRYQKKLTTGETVWKLAKKYPSTNAFARPMTNLYLTPEEFLALTHMPHRTIVKTRHHLMNGPNRWALDVFGGELAGLAMAEIECDSLVELMSVIPPEWVKLEVTQDALFSGGNLSRMKAATLSRLLGSI
jgi:CYTH domain-containing protein